MHNNNTVLARGLLSVTMAPGIQIQTSQEVTPPKYLYKLRTSLPCEDENCDLEAGDEILPFPPKPREPPGIIDLDKNTPDAHVPRDPRLIRLTGVHPFNAEPPLSSLHDEGIAITQLVRILSTYP